MTRCHPVFATCLIALLAAAPAPARSAAKTTAPAPAWRGWDKGLEEAKTKGWTVVDMRKDWKVVFRPTGKGSDR